MASPDSLKADARPIAFTLHDTSGDAKPVPFQLFVRPEDLSITYPSRLAITQTFGEDGAWGDSFGPGIKSINLSGVTGWRGPRGVGAGNDDGFQHFEKLHKTVFTEWHSLRDKLAKAGKDPDKVLLILSDGLDNLNWVVAPQQFVLKRNKSRPLLAQYNISMYRLRDHAKEKGSKVPGADEAKVLAISSLENSLKGITDFSSNLSSMGALGAMKAAISSFVALTAAIARTVIGAIKAITSYPKAIVGELIGIAQNIMRAGINIAQTFAFVSTFSQQIRAQFGMLASAYTSMMCVLTNVFKKRTFLPNYNIYGAGSCSSTSGGRGISNYVSENTFASVLTTGGSSTSVSGPGASAISFGMMMDPTTATPKEAGDTAAAIASGVQVQSSSSPATTQKLENPSAADYANSWPGKDSGAPMPNGWTG